MRATRRRQRTPDPLTNPTAVRALCQELRSRLPGIIPNLERQLVRFLYAVRHVERRPATDTKRGRPHAGGAKISSAPPATSAPSFSVKHPGASP